MGLSYYLLSNNYIPDYICDLFYWKSKVLLWIALQSEKKLNRELKKYSCLQILDIEKEKNSSTKIFENVNKKKINRFLKMYKISNYNRRKWKIPIQINIIKYFKQKKLKPLKSKGKESKINETNNSNSANLIN